MRPLLPIALASAVVACSSSTPPSPAGGTASTTGAVVDGGGHVSRPPVARRLAYAHTAFVAVVLPAASPAVRRYAFWGTSPVPGVVVAEILPPSSGAIRVAWDGPDDAPIELHVLAYDVDPASGVPTAWPGGAVRAARPLATSDAPDAWTIDLAPATGGALG